MHIRILMGIFIRSDKMKYLQKAKILYTVCPGSSDPFYIASLLNNMGHYFLDILYNLSECT